MIVYSELFLECNNLLPILKEKKIKRMSKNPKATKTLSPFLKQVLNTLFSCKSHQVLPRY